MAHLFQVSAAHQAKRFAVADAQRLFRLAFRLVLFGPVLLLLITVYLPAATPSKEPPAPTKKKAKPARLKITGYGLLGNRELRRSLVTLELEGKKPDHFGPSFVEDSALILAARIKRDGYLEPNIQIEIHTAEGATLFANAAELQDNPLPRPLRITRVHFRIHKGVLYFFHSLSFNGLSVIPSKQARSYFIEEDMLFNSRSARIFTPERLSRGLGNLAQFLDQEGYDQAKVEASHVQRNNKNGAVNVTVQVRQGPKFIARSVQEEFSRQGAPQPERARKVFPNKPFSRLWLQDFTLSLKTNEFVHGFPDAKVEIQTLGTNLESGQVMVDMQAKVESGPQIRIGQVRFEGQKRTKTRLLARSVRVQHGDLLDPIQIEAGRYRLARLGVLDSVGLDYQPVDPGVRDVIFQVHEGKLLSISLLAGWGSYELLRGGIEAELNDIWGLAHHAEVKAVQSFKATSGELTYTIPEFVGKDVDIFLNGSGLRREEISFTRLEYGGSLGLHKYFQASATDVSARYNYQILNALNFSTVQEVATEGLTNPAVGSVIFDIKHDRRDNPLYPRHGYKFFLTVQTASSYMGGDANFERIEWSPSWYLPLGGGRYLGLGISQGVDVSFGSPANNLPFNSRFFPGGQNSIRGYQEGEASPRNELGQFVGAETYTLGTVELEQALTPKWSLIFFSDSMGMARRIEHYPWDTGLFSVGAGIWWRSLIGPIRLEYGYNLNPRPGDPSGTLQFSLGFPF